MARSAKATGFALVPHSQQVSGIAGKIKISGFVKPSKLCVPQGIQAEKGKLWIFPTLREAFLSVLSTSPSKNGMANELRSCKDRRKMDVFH